MGYNSTILVMNDALGAIEKDAEFGKKLSDAIFAQYVSKQDVDISSGGNVNAATVIAQAHADETTILAVGGNCGTKLHTEYNWHHNKPEDAVRILKNWANELGYRIVRKSTKRS